MAFVHGKDTYVSLDGSDLSEFTNNTEVPREADTHDVTTYGKSAHVFVGGLLTGTATLTGIYDNTAVTGPAAVIEPLLGTTVPFVFRPEGVGAGKPERSGDVVVKSYQESAPVADVVKWTCELQLSDDFLTTAQAV